MSWPSGQGIGLAILRSSVRTLSAARRDSAITAAPLWYWDASASAVPEVMVEYIDLDFFFGPSATKIKL